MLNLNDVHSYYGQIHALDGISFKVEEGSICCLIGANGAGKSTTLMTICNIVKAEKGRIVYQGQLINKVLSAKLPTMGLCQVPEGRRIFPRLTVKENLRLGAFFRNDTNQIMKDIEYSYDLFPILGERRNQEGGTLSGGEQQMLAIARALMARPRLLLLDEPSLGLAPLIVQQIFDIIKKINKEGTTILLVEQNANLALQTAGRGYVVETGKITLEDDARALLSNPKIREAYLGE